MKQKPYSLYSELGRTVFPVESTNNIRIKVTYLRVMGDGCIWKRIELMDACWVSESVIVQCHEILITVTDDLVVKMRHLMEKWYFIWKWYWKGCIIKNKKWDKIIVKFWPEKILCKFLSCTKHLFDSLNGTKYCTWINVCVTVLY